MRRAGLGCVRAGALGWAAGALVGLAARAWPGVSRCASKYYLPDQSENVARFKLKWAPVKTLRIAMFVVSLAQLLLTVVVIVLFWHVM